MNFFEQILVVLKGEMQTPTNYSPFHLASIAITLITTILLCTFGSKVKDKTFRGILLACWIVIVLLEIYKQIDYVSFRYIEEVGIGYWKYNWAYFPYQLCSTPLYCLPLIIFMKDGKVRDAIMSFISTFALFGGLIVFIYPNDVFVSQIGINIQTMVHHGLQIVLGVYITFYNRKKLGWKYFLRGIYVFLIALTLAVTLNVIVDPLVADAFNMFYVGPITPCSLVILDKIYLAVPYVVFLLIYTLGFILAAFLMYVIQLGLVKLFTKREKVKSE